MPAAKKTTAPKRAAEAPPAEETPAKKLATNLKKHNVTQAAYKNIAEVLEHPMAKEIFTEETREMLLVMLPHSICVPTDERQEFQVNAVTMLSQLMSQISEKMHLSLDEENEKVSSAEAMKTDLEAKIQAAEAALKDTAAVTSECQTELDSTIEKTSAAQAELNKAKEEQANGEASLTTARESKEALESGIAGVFSKLKAGEWEDGEVEELFKSVEPLLAKLELDASLKTATRPTLMKKPDKRGMFDAKVVEELDKSFAKTIEELGVTIAQGQPQSEAWAVAVSGAAGNLEVAQGAQKAAAEALASAKTSQKEATSALKAAKAALADYKPEYKKATELRDSQQNQIQTFNDVNMAAFEALKDKISAKKKKQMAAEAAEKAAAEAAEKAAAEKAAAEKAAAEAAEKAAAEAAEKAALEAEKAAEKAAAMAIDEAAMEVEAPAEVPKVEAPACDTAAAEVGGA